jgi:hypothetical protein
LALLYYTYHTKFPLHPTSSLNRLAQHPNKPINQLHFLVPALQEPAITEIRQAVEGFHEEYEPKLDSKPKK